MGRITSNVGLITGLPITDTVDQLMTVAGKPRDLLANRTKGLQSQQSAISALSARLLSFDFSVNKLKSSNVFQAREATSSNPDALTVSVPSNTSPPVGNFQIQPVRVASTQQLISDRFESSDSDLGDGAFSFRFGGFVDKGVSLEQLNSGEGVQRGKIKITDRSGASSVVDLSFAQSIDDVIHAINANETLNVTAKVSGDAIALTDGSGGAGNLIVQDVGNGKTAANLGLGAINAAASSVTGSDVFSLHAGSKLTSLNDGNGVRLTAEGINDLEITLSDGSAPIGIDLAETATLGEVVDAINAASPGNLAASISADGNRLEINDLTGGAGNFSISSGAAGSAAEDLGIAASATAPSISGQRLTSGLAGTLLGSLNGGQGLGDLGVITITDRNAASDTVDLSGAETLADVVDAINASTADVTASINASRNGISIADNSGGSGNLTIANNDAIATVEALGIGVDDAVAAVNSGTLNRQTLSEATLLSSLNGGDGVKVGDIRVTNGAGVSKAADLNGVGNEARTVGDVIDAINALNNGVTARINDAGDGILVVNTAAGDSSLGISDVNGNLASSLRLTGASKTVEINGVDTQVIDGTSTESIDVSNLTSTGESVLLSDLNNGEGITRGTFKIADSDGGSVIAINLNQSEAGVTTVGELVAAINQKAAAFNVGVTASINDAGTGIQLTDTAGGSGDLEVTAVNGSSVVADLKLDAKVVTSGGQQTINGAGTFKAGSSAQTGLDALAARINERNAGVTASTVFDGIGYRLSIVADKSGSANELLLDTGGTPLKFSEISKGQDALLAYGDLSTPGSGVLISSATNKFEQVVGGVNLEVQAASDAPVSVAVKSNDEPLVDAVQGFVDSYNSIRKDLDQLTDFNQDDLSTGLLFGTNEALQVDTRLSHALTDRYFGVGDFQSLKEVGVSLNSDGKLELNKAKLQEAFADDPASVKELFTNPEKGVVAKVGAEIDFLASDENSVLTRRTDSLQRTIDSNNDRLEDFQKSLDKQRETLLNQFYQLEQIISGLKQNQTALGSLQPVAPLTSTR